MHLKKEALDKFNLPIEVFYGIYGEDNQCCNVLGFLGRLELHIPWRNLKTQPVKVVIEDLFLLAGPRVETKYDPEAEREREQRAKQEKLETAELFASGSENKLSQDIHHESFTTQLVTKIVDNLQISIKNIHIRYEDSSSNPNRLFSLGITLESLKAVSTDANWNETFIVNPQDAVNKLISLDNLSIYWNTAGPSIKDLSFEEFIDFSRNSISDESHSYILKPVSGVGKATLNKFFKEGIPKTLIDIFFDAFGLNVNYEQYYDILSVLAAFSTAQRALPFRKYRPAGRKMSPSELFKYAAICYQSQIHERIRLRTWKYILQRRVDRLEYINLFSNKILLGGLNDIDSKALATLEEKLDFDDIMQYRSLARAFAKKSQANSPKGYGGRLLNWLGFKSSANVPRSFLTFSSLILD